VPVNVEVKAVLRDRPAVEARAAAMADGPVEVIEQHDVFFTVPGGRLKLRRFPGGVGELIFYRRADSAGPTASTYHLVGTDDPEGLAAVLEAACGRCGEVRKVRRLYLVGRTRIHLDRVEGLGDFLELEVVLGDGDDEAEGRAEARRLMIDLAIDEADLLEGAYVDLAAAE